MIANLAYPRRNVTTKVRLVYIVYQLLFIVCLYTGLTEVLHRLPFLCVVRVGGIDLDIFTRYYYCFNVSPNIAGVFRGAVAAYVDINSLSCRQQEKRL